VQYTPYCNDSDRRDASAGYSGDLSDRGYWLNKTMIDLCL